MSKQETDMKISKRREFVQQGILHAAYSEEYFCCVKPAYLIEKVLFDFVKTGTSGQVHVPVYMDVDQFKAWMTDVKNNTFMEIINGERAVGEKYPKVYKYVTGTKGEKSVGFGAGIKSFAVLQGCGYCNGKKLNVMLPVTRSWLMILADMFFGTSKAFYEEMYRATLKNAEKYYTSLEYTNDDISEYSANTGSKESAPTAADINSQNTVSNTQIANRAVTFVKCGQAVQLQNQHGNVFLNIPVRVQTKNGGYEKQETQLVLFAKDFSPEIYAMFKETSPECLMPFSGTVEQAAGMYKLVSLTKEPTVRMKG